MDITTTYSGNIVDVVNKKIFKGTIEISNNKILRITEDNNTNTQYIMPGFVDAHVHIESSMLIPSKFSETAVEHGIVACVSDPHEITNVMGREGIDFMLDNAKEARIKFFFGAPSCVPATDFETSGARLNSSDIDQLLQRDDIKFLSEMMNFPGVIYNDEEVSKKLAAAKRHQKPIDGHAPGLSGPDLEIYAKAGISTDHECTTIAEAEEKIKLGMNILIREGSAAKNFDTLSSLIATQPEKIMLCTDDTHPEDLIKGTIIRMVKRAIEKGYNLFDVLRAANYNAIKHYKLPIGLLQKGDNADFIIVDNLENLEVKEVVIDGTIVPRGTLSPQNSTTINRFNIHPIEEKALFFAAKTKEVFAIEVIDKELYTRKIRCTPKVVDNNIVSDTENDLLKIVVVNRYENKKPVVGIIKNIGIKQGAVATSIAHDSHNIVAVGCSDREITKAINTVIKNKGGIVVLDEVECIELPLPIGGIMTNLDATTVANLHEAIDNKVKVLGSTLTAPLMTLSFMCLLVIPEFKIGDKGLFDGNKFEITSAYCE